MSELIAWKNGKQTRFNELALPVWDLGVVAGASITEMARTYRHKPFRLPEHLKRLSGSCKDLGFTLPYDIDELETAADAVARQNARLLGDDEDLGIVVFVTAGGNTTYLGAGDVPGPSVVIHTFRLPFEIWTPAARDGVRLTIPSRTQIPSSSLPVEHKTRNRLHWWLADKEATEVEAGSRALLLDQKGRITETSTACFFAVIDGRLLTPKHNVLNSMSCRIVRELASTIQVKFSEAELTPEDIPRMSEAFVSSTPVGIFHVSSINRSTIGADGPGAICEQLRSAWGNLTGLNPTEQILRFGG